MPFIIGVWELPEKYFLIFRENLAPLHVGTQTASWLEWGLNPLINRPHPGSTEKEWRDLREASLGTLARLPDCQKAERFVHALRELSQMGLFLTRDYHHKNIRLREATGEWVVSDLGRSQGPAAEVPIAKNPALPVRRPAGLPPRPPNSYLWGSLLERDAVAPYSHVHILRKKLERLGLYLGASLGKGYFGEVYALWRGSKSVGVVKVTRDFSEAAAAANLMRVKNPAIPKIQQVVQINLPNIKPAWAIFREDLEPLPGAFAALIYKGDLDVEEQPFLLERAKDWLSTTDFRKLYAFIQNVRKLQLSGKFDSTDLHNNNIRVRPATGELVISDLGVSYGPAARIPVLKNP